MNASTGISKEILCQTKLNGYFDYVKLQGHKIQHKWGKKKSKHISHISVQKLLFKATYNTTENSYFFPEW